MKITNTETDPVKIQKILKNSKRALILLPFISIFALIITGMDGFIFDIILYTTIAFVAIYAKTRRRTKVAIVLSVIELIFLIVSLLVGSAPIIAIIFPIIAIDRTMKILKYKFPKQVAQETA